MKLIKLLSAITITISSAAWAHPEVESQSIVYNVNTERSAKVEVTCRCDYWIRNEHHHDKKYYVGCKLEAHHGGYKHLHQDFKVGAGHTKHVAFYNTFITDYTHEGHFPLTCTTDIRNHPEASYTHVGWVDVYR